MSLDMAGRRERFPGQRVCPCHDPDGDRTHLVRWTPFYGAVTWTHVDSITGERRRCAPVTTESNG